jgi:hypothetical protein
MRFVFTAILQLLLLSARLQVVARANCQMSIWVFDSYDNCYAQQAPNTDGVIYADGQCHTVQTDSSTGSSNYALLPGTYRAECTSGGKIRFLDSGCLDSQCTATFAARALSD